MNKELLLNGACLLLLIVAGVVYWLTRPEPPPLDTRFLAPEQSPVVLGDNAGAPE